MQQDREEEGKKMIVMIRHAYQTSRYLRDQRGIETVEWLLIAALIVAMAVVVYPGELQPALQKAIAFISGKITAIK